VAAAQTTAPTQRTETGAIVGIVRNDRPATALARAQVQAFSLSAVSSFESAPGSAAFMRPSGTAQADGEGRFRIPNLPPGEYLVAATMPSIAPTTAGEVYVPTFYPSVAEQSAALPVHVSARSETSVAFEVVRVRALRISGTVVRESGTPVQGTKVMLYQRFGGYGGGSRIAVGADGRFVKEGLAPGWYGLSVDWDDRPDAPQPEYAEMIIEARDRDIDNLQLVIRRSATITGRVVGEPGIAVAEGLLRISASRSSPFLNSQYPSTLTQNDGAFTLDAAPGQYVFSVRADRPPFVEVRRVTIDGVEGSLGELNVSPGPHEVTLTIGIRAATSPTQASAVALSSSQLLEQFLKTPTLDAALQLTARGDATVLPRLVDYLKDEDRHVRGNAAVVFAAFGDPRGFETISAILSDRSNRPPGQGQAGVSSDGRYHVEQQIKADRYYAAHLLGDIRDPRGVALLVPLVADRDVDYIVPWSLGQIGGPAAVTALMDLLGHAEPSIRVLAIYALESLDAREALPRLEALVGDESKSNFGNAVTVGAAAKAAIATLRGK
jgi:hypothetical protein